MPSPVETPVKSPVRTEPDRVPDPDRYYQPERLCPQQKKDATRWSAP